MAKFYNSRVKTGRLAGSVFAIRNGETIERAYQPVVSNPNTPAQVAVRAKLKVLSQLSAVLAPAIAMPRVGSVSTRNRFTKENYLLTSFATDTASIDLTNVQLTKSVVALPSVVVQRSESNFSLSLSNVTPLALDRVVYVVLAKSAGNKLRFVESTVVSTPGENFNFNGILPAVPESCVVYAYGIRDNNDRARVTFGNLSVLSAESVATLLTSRTLQETDVTLTETRGVNVPAAV